MKIKKGDKIIVIAGRDRGKIGTVDNVDGKNLKMIVSGINIITKHAKPSRKNPKGGVLKMPTPINISKVMLLCPKCDKPGRVGMVLGKAGKERICKRCKQVIA